MRLRTRTAAVVGSAVIGLAALGGGVALATGTVPGGDDLSRPGSITVDERTLPENDAAEREALASLATVERAAAGAAAVEAVGGGEVVRAELEDEDGSVVWEVLVRADDGSVREVIVDAGDASVLGSEREDDGGEDRGGLRAAGTLAVDESTLPENDAAERDALAAVATIDEAAAGTAAAESVGGGEVVRAELEEDAGFVVWDVLVRSDDGTWHEVAVDAGDASILATELDDDDDDEDDD